MKRNKHRFFIITIIVALVLFIWGTSSYSKGKANLAQNTVGSVMSPVQSFFVMVGDFFGGIPDYFTSKKALIKENEALKKQNAILVRENEKALSLQAENDWLYGFLELKREKNDYEYVNAKIISRSGNFTTEFTLDKGSIHGIEKDMCVITEDECLLGVITEVGLNYSKGVTVIDDSFSAGIYIERTGDPGIISGTYENMSEGLCVIPSLPSNANLITGDFVYTSGLGEVFPKGLYIGKVERIESDNAAFTLSAVVKPAVELLDIDRVMVVTKFSSAYE